MKKLSMALIAALIIMPILAQGQTTDVSGNPLAVIIISPLILGFMFIASAFLLDPLEHGVLRIFFVLFALMTYFLSAWMGMQTIINYYTFDALQESLAISVWVMGGAMFVILSYFLIYAFYKATEIAAQKKKEMMLQ